MNVYIYYSYSITDVGIGQLYQEVCLKVSRSVDELEIQREEVIDAPSLLTT